jgi:ketosteroid isomerase-like protein
MDERGLEGMKTLCRISALVVAAALAQSAFAATTGDAAQEVLAAEQARTAALDRSDVATLTTIMAEDVTYVHASGKVDTRQSYLAAIESGQLHYISWRPDGLHVRVLGDTAVLTGEYAVRVIDARVQPEAFDIDILVLSVYARREGRWRQIAWQSTRRTAATGSK